MSLQLFTLPEYPDEVAVSKVGAFVPGGAFLLDFSRPLTVYRWLGVRNKWIGFAGTALVPVVHEGEEKGGFVVYIGRSDPCFHAVLHLWKVRYPSPKRSPKKLVEGLQLIADFAKQFPDDASSK
jgi:hypothetical protein